MFAAFIPWRWHVANIRPYINLSCWRLRHRYWGMWNLYNTWPLDHDQNYCSSAHLFFTLQSLNWHIAISVLVWYRAVVFKLLIFWYVTTGVPIKCCDAQNAEQWVLKMVCHGLYYATRFEFPSVYHTGCLIPFPKGYTPVEPISEYL